MPNDNDNTNPGNGSQNTPQDPAFPQSASLQRNTPTTQVTPITTPTDDASQLGQSFSPPVTASAQDTSSLLTPTQTNPVDPAGSGQTPPPANFTPEDAVVTSPHTPRKYGGKKIIATIFGLLLLVGAVASGVFLVQREQDIREKAASGSECQQDPNCELLDNPGNKGSYTAPGTITHLFITAKEYVRFDPPGKNDGCYDVDINDRKLEWERVGSGPDCKDISNIQVWIGQSTQTPTPTSPAGSPTTTITPTGAGVPSCPSGTELLFANSGSLSVGKSVAAGGTVSALQGSWSVGSKDGVRLAEGGRTISVNFPNPVLLDTVLIFDNDPKSGENPWSINGVSLPVTAGDKWAPPYKLNKTATQMNFDNGGDSPHFNVCVKGETPTATPTPTLPPDISAVCHNVVAYDTDWNILSTDNLKSLEAGDIVRFAVLGTTSQGSFDKARFTINGSLQPEVTTKKPGSDEFYDEYTIPQGTTSFTVTAQVHHTSLGWF